jgi:hypothetical protein
MLKFHSFGTVYLYIKINNFPIIASPTRKRCYLHPSATVINSRSTKRDKSTDGWITGMSRHHIPKSADFPNILIALERFSPNVELLQHRKHSFCAISLHVLLLNTFQFISLVKHIFSVYAEYSTLIKNTWKLFIPVVFTVKLNKK